MKRYNPKEIEPKWQKKWDESGVYKADLNSDKPKYIGFAMFNYPSGSGIHIGHGKNFTLPDVILRYKRQKGYEAYSPVGFDSFGLPAENYAIKTGTPPRITTDRAIENYRKQYKAMGWGQDWSREIDTSQPEYYKWTQWVFSKLFEHGLAYQKESAQWWCDQCKTVLANEQVIDGKCWRHDGPDDPFVRKKSLKQWFFKITEYLDEILEATDDLDWTESVKLMQKNWIGRSEGALVKFQLAGLGADKEHLEVFTTAHDTIFGTTFMVVAPEHPIVQNYAQFADNANEIEAYVEKSLRKSELDREINQKKTGIEIRGLKAINPANGQEIPVWVADYVLITYGSGAVMAVPGEDGRDFEFAKKYELPIVYTTEQQEFVDYSQEIKPNRKKYKLANSGKYSGLDFETARQKILEDLEKTDSASPVVQYKMRDWLISRQRYWGAPIPIIHCPKDGAVSVPEKDLPVILPELENFAPTGETHSVLAGVDSWVNVSCPVCNGPAKRETDTMDGYACSSWYFLRYLDPVNTEKAWSEDLAKKWMPVDFYNGGDHATAHLLYARFFMRFFYKIGLVSTPEPFKKMYYHAKIVSADGAAFSKSKGTGPDPLKLIESGYGADSIRLYILFMSPADIESPWNDDGVPGTYRFLNRLWVLTQEFLDTNQKSPDQKTEVDSNIEDYEQKILEITHKTIKKVSEDIESVKYNTAIAAMMEAVNELYKLKVTSNFLPKSAWQEAIEIMLQLLAPFAPHICEELWQQIGKTGTIHRDNWPELNEKYLLQKKINIVVQVNGKLRANITVSSGCSKEELEKLAQEHDKVSPYLTNAIKKTIYVPDRLINFVI